MKRLSDRPLPSYAFIPGKTPRPEKDDPVSGPITVPEEHELFRYGIDLFNFGFLWESHVYFEAIWNAHQRQGPTADFLKALIKLGAAGIKFQLGQSQYAVEHLERAAELLRPLGNEYLGFKNLLPEIEASISGNELRVVLVPEWD